MQRHLMSSVKENLNELTSDTVSTEFLPTARKFVFCSLNDLIFKKAHFLQNFTDKMSFVTRRSSFRFTIIEFLEQAMSLQSSLKSKRKFYLRIQRTCVFLVELSSLPFVRNFLRASTRDLFRIGTFRCDRELF